MTRRRRLSSGSAATSRIRAASSRAPLRASRRLPRTRVLACRRTTRPRRIGVTGPQPDYVNAVALLSTALPPRALLRAAAWRSSAGSAAAASATRRATRRARSTSICYYTAARRMRHAAADAAASAHARARVRAAAARSTSRRRRRFPGRGLARALPAARCARPAHRAARAPTTCH